MRCPESSSHSPGAVRADFPEFGTSGTIAWRTFSSGIAAHAAKTVLDKMQDRVIPCSLRPSNSATVSRVRSSWVGPNPPDEMINSTRPSASRTLRATIPVVGRNRLAHHLNADTV